MQIALKQKRASNPTMLAMFFSNFGSLFEQNAYLLDPGLFESVFRKSNDCYGSHWESETSADYF